MSEVESVATWAGLITGITGIVLAIVTIWFATGTDKRAKEVNDQMIRSLQKIESAVERTSGDTQELIKVAWDRMLASGSTSSQASAPSGTFDVQAIASGIAAELNADIRRDNESSRNGGEGGKSGEEPSNSSNAEKQINELVPRIVETLAGQLGPGFFNRSVSEQTEFLLLILRNVPQSTVELVRELLVHGHLNYVQYRRALGIPTLKEGLEYLRKNGLLVPLRGHGDDEDQPVYWFPPGTSRVIRSALALLNRDDNELGRYMHAHLVAIGVVHEAVGPGGNDHRDTNESEPSRH